MAIPDLGDRRLNLLAEVYVKAAREIAAELEELLFAPENRKWAIYRQLLTTLAELEEVTHGWAKTHVQEFFKEQGERVLALSPEASVSGIEDSFNQMNRAAVEALVESMLEHTDAAIASVRNLARKVLQRAPALGPKFTEELRKEIASTLAKGGGRNQIVPAVRVLLQATFRDGVVSLIGKNGRTFRYGLDYYASLVAHQTQRQAMTAGTISKAKENGFDLVRISPNPSTIGDYCDLYRGRVFSITGASERFPYLGDTPNGGPPFHPWCKHSASVFIAELHTAEELAEWSDVPEEFLMQEGETDHSRILREYQRAKKENPNLGELRHI